MNILEVALKYWEYGWSVFPVKGKIAAVDWKTYQKERPTREQVEQWFGGDSDYGIAVALGRISNLLRVDVDGVAAHVELERLGGMPDTLSFSTPSGGFGYLLEYLEGVRTEKLWRGDGEHEELRVQSDGAYTVLPPSPHPDGGRYEWTKDARPARIPDWLRDRAVERVLQELVKELRPTLRQPDREEVIQSLEHISPEDYDTWVQVGMALRTAGDEYANAWVKWSKGSSKYREGECEKKWESFRTNSTGVTTRTLFYLAQQSGWTPPNKHEPLTDLGNARVLARLGEGRILHSSLWGWLAWDDKRWALEGAEKRVQELQKAALEYRFNRAVESMARHLKTDHEADNFASIRKAKSRTISAIRKHEDESRIRGARLLASSEPSISVDHRKFDSKHFLLNCNNGTLDVESLELRNHDPMDYITQLCPTPYVTPSDCPRFLEFLEQILPDTQVREFLQSFFGCCLTGDVSVQLMPVFHGSGANGKSTLIATIMHVLGEDYSMKAKRDFLMVKRNSDHPTSIARMRGKRFVVCVETEEHGRIDETLVKELTGGDAIAARRMREDEWEFVPTHKLVLVTNHKPEVRGTDDAIWRRLPLIPFEQKFPEGDPRRDPMLTEKLRAESSGILNWMIEGAQKWLKAGKRLERPETVKQASTAYREEQDKIGSFIEAKCVVGEGHRGRTEKIMEAYTLWCHLNKHTALNGNAFGRALTERGFHMEGKGSKYRLGIDLAGPEK